MTDPETPTQPLLSGRTGNNEPPAQGSTRAYKVAGFTLLACALIAGQAITAYFLLSQRGEIRSLEEQNKNQEVMMTRGGSGGAPMRMHVPMNALPVLMDDSVDEEASTQGPKLDPSTATECQLQAAGLKPLQVPYFRPACDERGLYKAKQCFQGHCWCVNPANGQETPDNSCLAVVKAGRMSKVLTLPDVAA